MGVSVIHHGWTYACKIDLSKTRGHPDSIRIMEKTLFGTILTIMGLLTAPSSLGVASPLPNVSDTFLVCGSFQLAACDYQIHSLSRQTSNLLSLPLADLCLHFQEVSAQAAQTGWYIDCTFTCLYILLSVYTIVYIVLLFMNVTTGWWAWEYWCPNPMVSISSVGFVHVIQT